VSPPTLGDIKKSQRLRADRLPAAGCDGWKERGTASSFPHCCSHSFSSIAATDILSTQNRQQQQHLVENQRGPQSHDFHPLPTVTPMIDRHHQSS
jgi:hypothetical protein